MDKEIIQRMFRIVGQVEGVNEAAKQISPMPNDKRTQELLESARYLLNKAVLSSWEYALEADRKSVDG